MNPLAIPGIIETVSNVADSLFTSDEERMKAELDGYKAETDRMSGQIEINKIEAASGNRFNSGWRPAIGWTCAISLFCYYVPYVLAATGLWVWQVVQKGELVARPDLGIADLIGLVTAMLGLAGMRSIEKVRGKT